MTFILGLWTDTFLFLDMKQVKFCVLTWTAASNSMNTLFMSQGTDIVCGVVSTVNVLRGRTLLWRGIMNSACSLWNLEKPDTNTETPKVVPCALTEHHAMMTYWGVEV
jgi:hypothetical protein